MPLAVIDQEVADTNGTYSAVVCVITVVYTDTPLSPGFFANPRGTEYH